MLFNSLEYLIFFPIVVALYYAINNKWRWLLLLAASYFFYMSWKAEYVILIMASTIVDYYAGLQMGKAGSRRKKKPYLILSIIVNLGILAGFKYFNFFSENMNVLFGDLNIFYRIPELKVLLPVGISFYTFQTLSYSIDVYRGITRPEKHLGRFALYVSYFPQLVAGPIERSYNLLPQLNEKKAFDPQNLISGSKLMLWGFFKKIVIADRIGIYVTSIYANPGEHTGLPVILATILFAFQLYCDFSAYTDIARGTARLMGIDLMKNFNRPLIARSLTDFWNRWHISLTSWFRDYLYFSLPSKAGNKVRVWRLQLNIIITFLLMGLWHGANWTFIIFGLIHGILLVMDDLTKESRKAFFKTIGLTRVPYLLNSLSILVTFTILVFSIYFFRAASIQESLFMIKNSFIFDNFRQSLLDILKDNEIMFAILQIGLLFWAEWYHAKKNLVKTIAAKPIWLRWSIYIGFIFYVLIFGIINRQQEFIYFQF